MDFLKKFEGHPAHWIFGGIEDKVNIDKIPKSVETNGWIVPAPKVFIGNDAREINYLRNIKRLFWTTANQSRKIYSSYFPDANLQKSYTTKDMLNAAKVYFDRRQFEYFELQDVRIKQLISTKHLIAVVTDVSDKIYITRINTNHQSGFSYDQPIYSELVTDEEVDFNQKLVAFDIGNFETEIILLSKNKQLLSGRFSHNKRNPVKLTPILQQELSSPRAICLCQIAPNTTYLGDQKVKYEQQIAVLDSGSVKIFEINPASKTDKYRHLRSANIQAANLTGICFFSLHSVPMGDYKKDQVLDFVICYSEENLLAWNLLSDQIIPLIGSGQKPLDAYFNKEVGTDNLNNYFVPTITKCFAIAETGIFFGNDKELLVLLTESAKNIFTPTKTINLDYGIGDS